MWWWPIRNVPVTRLSLDISTAVQFLLPVLWTSHFTLLTLDPRCHSYVMSKHKHRCSDGKMVYRLASLLSLLGDGFKESFPGFPLVGVAAAAGSTATAAARLIGSSALDRSSGLGWEGGACSEVGGDVSSCCILWVWRRRSWHAVPIWPPVPHGWPIQMSVFILQRKHKQRQRLDWCIDSMSSLGPNAKKQII